ncbi:MAG: SDR family NAD(P)-dependent oxidoreductase [Acidimicrobiales bacterium]
MNDEPRFDGRVVLVTGAARGLGRAYAELLAARGARVIVNDMDHEAADATAGELGVQVIAADVSTEASARSVIEQAGPIDVLIANAGVSWHRDFAELTASEFDDALRHNLASTFHIVQAAWPQMAADRYGRVVTTASGGIFGIAGRAHYVAAKGAVWALTKTLALEGEPHGIQINCVLPWGLTRMAREGSTAPPADDAAAAVAWLCHEQCAITGEAFTVGGGKIARVVLERSRSVEADPARIAAQRAAFARLMTSSAAPPQRIGGSAAELTTPSNEP